MKAKERNELAIGKVVVAILAIIGIIFVIWFAWIRPEEDITSIDSYDECVAAGYPVQLSYPSACAVPNGPRFVNPNEKIDRADMPH